MHFASVLAGAIVASFTCLANVVDIPAFEVSTQVSPPAITLAPGLPHDRRLQSRAAPKRPKYTRPVAKKRPRPIKHPKGCDNTELLKNGDFDKNVRGWTAYSGATGLAQLFWVKDSKRRPAHSGDGQAYIFLNRGPAIIDFETKLPAVEFGNAITISMWMRYEEPANLSGCYAYWTVRGADVGLDVTLKPKWTKYSFEVPGFGRASILRFVMQCDSLATPVSIYMDDVSAKACVPKRPDPECQVLKACDNLLVNPGFECAEGITAWQTQSYNEGTESLEQFGNQRGNSPRSGQGMAGFVFANGQFPGFTGLSIFQFNIPGDLTRKFMKASFWLSVDAQAGNTTGCELSVATRTGYYLYSVDLSKLTPKWTKYEIKNIEPDSLDDFRIDISGCRSDILPVIYIDDIYFGVDRAAPPATSTVITEPTVTPTPGPCTSFPSVADPSIELNDNMNNWMQSNGEVMIFPDSESTYGPPHDGRAVAVIQLPPTQPSVSLSQYTSGFCANQAYTASVWLYIPVGYDPRRCQFRLGITGASDLFNVSRAGNWEKLELIFYVEEYDTTNPFLDIHISAFCENLASSGMIVLVDDFRYGPAPPCSITPTIPDGSFESGNLTIWDAGGFQGDETFAITSAKPRTGTKSAVLTFPKIANGLSFANNFAACVGGRYTFRLWYFVPSSTPKGITCTINAYAYFTGESSQTVISVYDAWTEATLDFVAGGSAMTVVWSVVCGNQLQKVVIYVDDVSVTKR